MLHRTILSDMYSTLIFLKEPENFAVLNEQAAFFILEGTQSTLIYGAAGHVMVFFKYCLVLRFYK